MATKYYDLQYSFSDTDVLFNILRDVNILGETNAYVQIVLLRLLIPRGSYVFNPSLGSDLFLLKRQKISSITNRQIQNIIEKALDPEVVSGNLTNIRVTSEKNLDTIKVKVVVDVVNGATFDVSLLLNP